MPVEGMHRKVEIKSLVLIAGTARSGSTVLDMMLGTARDSVSTGELYAYYRPWRKHHGAIRCSCGQDECERWRFLDDVPERIAHSELIARTDVSTVIDSSKNLNWIVDSHDFANRSGIRPIVVLVWKEPIALAYSFWKRDRHDWRSQFVRYHRRLLETGLPFVSVNHNALVKTPRELLGPLARCVGLIDAPEAIDEMLQYGSRAHHHLYGSLTAMSRINGADNSGLAAEKYDRAFDETRASIERELPDDEELSGLMSAISKNDVRSSAFDAATLLAHSQADRHVWYYRRRLRDAITSRFPVTRR